MQVSLTSLTAAMCMFFPTRHNSSLLEVVPLGVVTFDIHQSEQALIEGLEIAIGFCNNAAPL